MPKKKVTEEELAQRVRDEEHLRLLSLFYYILGGISAFFSLFPLLYTFLGGFFLLFGATLPMKEGALPVGMVGVLIASIGFLVFLVLMLLSLLKIYAGYCLSKKKHRVFVMVMAVLFLLSFPYGTLLGIFTFMVLSRDTVIQYFEADEKKKEEDV